MNQSEFLAITCNLVKAREKSRVQGTISLPLIGLKTGARLELISGSSNRSRIVTFEGHFKTTLNK
mgnify:FL=1